MNDSSPPENNWIHCVASVKFDIDLGHTIDNIAGRELSPLEKKRMFENFELSFLICYFLMNFT